MTMYAPWRVEISDAWTAALERIGLVEIGYFTERDLRAAGVKELVEGEARPAHPDAQAGRLSADQPDLIDVIAALTRASFAFGMWWQTNNLQTDGLADAELLVAGERASVHGVLAASGEKVALLAERGEVWRYSLARLDVVADQLAAATFASGAGSPTAPKTFIGGWEFGWPAPPPARTSRTDHFDILGTADSPDTRLVIIQRSYGVQKETHVDGDVTSLSEMLRGSLQAAADDAARG